MSNEWMIDVLRDIRQVASRDAMLGLAEVLDDAIFVAAEELRQGGDVSGMFEHHDSKTRGVFGATGRGDVRHRPPEAG